MPQNICKNYKNGSKKQLMRKAFSIATKVGIIKKPNFNNDGISFVIPVMNEERTIEACLLSVMPVADEIIVVDSSTDSTTEKIASLANKHKKIKHIRFYCNDINSFPLQLTIGLTCVKYKWVFRFNSDMVAHDDMYKWKNRLATLDRNKYYVIDCPWVNLESDIFHQPKNKPFGGYEGLIFTWHPSLRWVLKPNQAEQVMGDSIYGCRFPPFYEVINFEEPYIFHLNIKSPKRRLERCFWTDYMNCKGKAEGRSFGNLEEYVRFRTKNDWNLSYEEALLRVIKGIEKNLAPYNEERFGTLPELILKKIYSPKLDFITLEDPLTTP